MRFTVFPARLRFRLFWIWGANIGLSVLYFKRLFPACRIYAYEPDPYIFEILQRNVTEFHLTDVTLVNEAVAEFSGELGFKSDHADGAVSDRMEK